MLPLEVVKQRRQFQLPTKVHNPCSHFGAPLLLPCALQRIRLRYPQAMGKRIKVCACKHYGPTMSTSEMSYGLHRTSQFRVPAQQTAIEA